MFKWILTAFLFGLIASMAITQAEAKGCIKGAIVGGVAGHYAGHHGFMGAAAGCLIGRHNARKHMEEQNAPPPAAH